VLDGLRVPDPGLAGRTRHAWLRSRPTTVSVKAMRRELDKRAFLVDTVGADRFELSELPPNRRAWLAQTGRQQTNQALARMASERRYPILIAFCVEALARVSDDAIEVFDRALGAADRARSSSAAAAATPRPRCGGSSISPAWCWRRTTPAPTCCG
jgi:hypothetical protein